jgi:hypothetical protein
MKNWKTTLTGVLGAVGLCVFQLISAGTLDPKTLIIAAIVAGIGTLAKDHDVTGSTIVQTSLPLAAAVLTNIPKADTSPILSEIHTIVSELAANQAAPIAETTSTQVA